MEAPRGDFADPFAPDLGDLERLVQCLHCGKVGKLGDALVFESRHGAALWWCSQPLCDGAGYRFDVVPVEIAPAEKKLASGHAERVKASSFGIIR
ncbi:MAG: hypothetical protein ACJ8NS_01325 [Chthoniobacterales bacterium]